MIAADKTPTQKPRADVGDGPWLNYKAASAYTGWSVPYLRNLVSRGEIPVFGRPRVRRFRKDMLDMYLADPSAAMRKFSEERRAAHGN